MRLVVLATSELQNLLLYKGRREQTVVQISTKIKKIKKDKTQMPPTRIELVIFAWTKEGF